LSRPSEELTRACRRRQAELSAWLTEQGLFACVVDDFENQRSNSLRWLCGQPTDALLVILASGKSILVPWDINLANERAVADQIVPYTDYKRSFREAVIGVLRESGLPQRVGGPRETDPASDPRPRVAFPARTSHLRYLELSGDLPGALVEVSTPGYESFITEKRNVKDGMEIAATRRAAAITNELVDLLEEIVRGSGDGLREIEVAQIIEREALARGAEGLGFETLAAGPARSWAIHPFPSYSNAPFGAPGLSILDFGVRVDGYTSDVTMTLIRGELSAEQERMVSLVEQAYSAAVGALRIGASCREPALRVEEVFSAAGQRMPHSLGHGIGLDTHESPVLRTQLESSESTFLSGMVFTIEPGLYDPRLGGVRWENDVLLTDAGVTILTQARIVRIP